MNAEAPIDRISIRGFKSIQRLDDLTLKPLNALIGANGVGKSNFIAFFILLRELAAGRLQHWTRVQGGADRLLSGGAQLTARLEARIEIDGQAYEFALEPTADGGFSFAREALLVNEPDSDRWTARTSWGAGHLESRLGDAAEAQWMREALAKRRLYHFHDTSDTAKVKRKAPVHDCQSLRSDAANLAPYLFRIQRERPEAYRLIRDTVRLALADFDDFVFQPETLPSQEALLSLLWRERGSGYVLWPSQFSDGSLRFICLVVALLDPEPPATFVIDEPELGLHPWALNLIGAMLRSASLKSQVIVSTQSAELVNEMQVEDLLIVEREAGNTTFRRLPEEGFRSWLEDYTLGELWQKNLLGATPSA